MKNCGILLFLFCFVFVVQGYPNGAPTTQDSCLNLQPLHTDPVTGEQYPNQQEQAPFRIEISTGVYQPCVMPIDCRRAPITVTIRGLSRYFRGFIIQARTQFGGAKAHGQFLRSSDGSSDGAIKLIDCPNGQTLTHTSNTDMQSVKFQWIPEPNMKENVQFVSTIVQTVRTIYTDVKSTEVTRVGTNQWQRSSGIVRTNSGPKKMFILQPHPQPRGQILRPPSQSKRGVINNSPSGSNMNTLQPSSQSNRVSHDRSRGTTSNTQQSVVQVNNRQPNSQSRGNNLNAQQSQVPINNGGLNTQSRGNNFNPQQSQVPSNTRGSNTQPRGTTSNVQQPTGQFSNMLPSSQLRGTNLNTTVQLSNRVENIQSNSVVTNNRPPGINTNNAGRLNNQPSAVGRSTSQWTNTITSNNQPMRINSARLPANNISTNRKQQSVNSETDAQKAQIAKNSVAQQPVIINALSQQSSNIAMQNFNSKPKTTVKNNRQQRTNNFIIQSVSTNSDNTGKFPAQQTGVKTTKFTNVQRKTTLITTTPIATGNKVTSTNSIDSKALPHNRISVSVQTDDNNINMETKPKNSGYRLVTSSLMTVIPLFLFLI